MPTVFADLLTACRRRLPVTSSSSLLRYLLPASCALCHGNSDGNLCRHCRQRFFSASNRRCVQCGLVLLAPSADMHTHCARCLRLPPAFDATITAVDYTPPLDRLVLRLKFGHQLALAHVFADLLRNALLQTPLQTLPDLLCVPPLGPARLRERGFNQALEIAKPLARALGVPLVPALLIRTRDTAPQTRLSVTERRQNIRGSFIVQTALQAQIHERHIGVVDDVMTTGETLNEIAATLKQYGALSVSNFVFARTLPADE